jgi:ArsR family transcriptional regulator, arsenate/arsenite/antimonite-responsive transcriptional repressor
MEEQEAIEALSALAQEHRLAIFRLLVRRGPSGLAAGGIAGQLGVRPSTLSHHLAHLERAGLLRSWRRERHIFYAVNVEGTRRLLSFLTEDCCGGRPELCALDQPVACCPTDATDASASDAGAEPWIAPTEERK